ncbi:M23 family metallopeptidase [bacterium]|nr:MAG: M23 family metallopeptidase [bacterium]
MSDRFLVKIIPPHGYSVYRLEVARRHLYAGAGVLAVLLAGVLGWLGWDLRHLHAAAEVQRRQLVAVDRQARALDRTLLHIQRQNAEIRRIMGLAPAHTPSARVVMPPHQLSYRGGSETVQLRLAALERLAGSVGADQRTLRVQALRTAAERAVQAQARARALAAIPSIMPVDGPIVSGFGYRTYPDREFHAGLDIAAGYGAPVEAAADGYVAAAGWDGGYGIKVDIDHGNGYHSWYAHLERTLVHAGQAVKRGETIGLVGATGFATGPHLHYQLMLDGRAVDPTPFLHGTPQDVIASSK